MFLSLICLMLFIHVKKNKLEVWVGIFSVILSKIILPKISRIAFAAKKTEYHFTQKLPKTAAVKRKKDLVLECMLSDPRPQVQWYLNGEPLEVSTAHI